MSYLESELSSAAHKIQSLPRLLPALLLLWRHYRDALAADEDPWEHAVAEAALCDCGVTPADLGWLADAQFVDYATLSDPHPDAEIHLPPANFSLRAQHFVLTPVGAALMKQATEMFAQDDATSLRVDGNGSHPEKPHWDAQRRELRYRGAVVKRFQKPAPNQELILAAFEESGWPPHIDDPLPPHADIPPPDRLHDTLGRLNRTLQTPLLRFGSDGTGQGVYWRPSQRH